ncbi:MAG: M20/M25/M40 family metallo-hydrolase [Myxococcales bacterium]|nr:MAG: M20/M25/M40 family metallo-hydrolase [Myxococcales bacterium]
MSPLFDAQWQANGHMDRAVDLIAGWCRSRPVEGLSVDVVRLADRTPVILMEIPGTAEGTVLLYGHLDKQPEMTGWSDGLGPWNPVLRDGRLYGRGTADDGYAAFASLTALEALHDAGLAHARCVILIEACEESGSFDLPAYIDHLADRIGTPDLVVCLDSGCGNYDQLWCTTSLRGLVSGDLHVDVLKEGVHSGDASGIVPSSFRIVRALLDRVEDAATGAIRDPAFHATVPEQHRAQARAAAEALGEAVWRKFPLVEGMRVVGAEPAELVLNRTWRPALSVTGAGGLPALDEAGNVLRPRTSLKLSLRLPPGVAAGAATARLRELLTRDPPCGARVSFEGEQGADGWNAPTLASWLEHAAERASQEFFGQPALYMGEGGSIPFMAMLGERFPDAQLFITGVLGPGSNAHGPNEFLELATAERLTCCVARIIEAHGRMRSGR